jgi:hypothetical protein
MTAPQISDRAVPFRSRLREIVRGQTEELQALAVEMYARGLSTRDIESLFADDDGPAIYDLRPQRRCPSCYFRLETGAKG